MHHGTAPKRHQFEGLGALLHPVRSAADRARLQERQRIIEQLRAQADLHRGFPGDRHRRHVLNSAADAIRDDRGVGRRRG